MSYSTTATSKFSLTKYSRAYPHKLHKSLASVPEWQHFTNPALYVVLDKTKSYKGELESLKLRVLWDMNDGEDISVVSSQAPIILEDLDLFSFSDIEKNTPKRLKESESLPLRAMHRDTLVGLKYLFSKVDAPQPIYRRFQLNFSSSKNASDFVHAIRTVCPCKSVPSATSQESAFNKAPTMARGQNMLQRGSSVIHPTTTEDWTGFRSASRPGPCLGSTLTLTRDMSNISSMASPDPTLGWAQPSSLTTLPLPSEPVTLPKFANERLITPCIVTKTMGPPAYTPANRSSRPSTESQAQLNQRASQLQPSSPLPPSDQSAGQPAGVTSLSSSPSTTQPGALLTSLREDTGLYDLSPEALEQAVAEIVREEGFLRLMERLSEMWRIHSIAGLSIS